MAVRKIQVLVSQYVDVVINTDKLDAAFMAEFRESFYPFETVEQHAEHIAQLAARNLIDNHRPDQFVEGYGPLAEMGIGFTKHAAQTEVCGDLR